MSCFKLSLQICAVCFIVALTVFQDTMHNFLPTKRSLTASLSKEVSVMVADRQVRCGLYEESNVRFI